MFDAESKALFDRDRQLAVLPNLHFLRTPAQSMAINRIRSGAIIIAGSGMCTDGRLKHHLKHKVWRRDCHLVIVGFQGRGTLGRQLVDGAEYIRLWGETVKVNAHAHTLGGFSAHSDQAGLCRWYANLKNAPPVVLVHGEPDAQQALATTLRVDHGAQVSVPIGGAAIDLPSR